MRTSNLFLMSGILLVASTAYSQCASCGGGAGGVHSFGGDGYGAYSAGFGGCSSGKCGHADHLWDGFCNEPSCGCGKFGGSRCGGLFSKFRGGCGGCGSYGGGWFGLGAGSQHCGCGGGCGCGSGCGCGTGHGLGSHGGFGWPNKLTYQASNGFYSSNAGSCCGGGYSDAGWSTGVESGDTWSDGNSVETLTEPEPQPATEPSTDSSTWQSPSSQWNVNERNPKNTNTFNAPVQTPSNQNNGPFHNIPQQNNRGGSKTSPTPSIDELPGGPEIDDFLNDA